MENVKFETFEWIRSWSDHAPETDLPRVLLVGDSITNGYQEAVRALLAGVCYVDFIATSYHVDNPLYRDIVRAFFHARPYAFVHFNNGLHGKHGDIATYEQEMDKLIREFKKSAQVMLVTCTNRYTNELKSLCPSWMPVIEERNAAIYRLAEKYGLAVDDLYTVSVNMPMSERQLDGVHYTEEGSRKSLAPVVAEAIKKALLSK